MVSKAVARDYSLFHENPVTKPELPPYGQGDRWGPPKTVQVFARAMGYPTGLDPLSHLTLCSQDF